MTLEQAQASRRRVRETLAHREPDRVPIDLGGTSVTGVHVSVVAGLREYYGMEKRPLRVFDVSQMLGAVEDDLATAMGIDVWGIPRRKSHYGFANENWKPWKFHGLDVMVGGGFEIDEEPDGSTVIYPQGDRSAGPSGRMPAGGWFFDAIIRQNHFDPDHLNPEDNLEEFKPIGEDDLEWNVRWLPEGEATGRGIIAGFGGTAFGDIAIVPAPGLKDPRGIRDITEWYVSLRSRRNYVRTIFERQCEIGIGNLERIHRAIGDRVDAVYLCGTDFGTQSSAFCSVTTFRELWLPYYKALCGWIRANTKWKCFKHSCGSVERFFDSLIEAGFDIINPVQCSAVGMDPAHLKRTYGDRLVFWGGGVDTQKTLAFGTPEEVREEVLRRCEVFAPGGGFVFNPVHNIQAQTPVANVVAMLNAVHEFNGVLHA